MNIYVCGAYGPRMGVYIYFHCLLNLHTHHHYITRRFLGVKETVKDYVPVDSESVTHNMWILLMFRSVMVHIEGTYVFLSRTISRFKYRGNTRVLLSN